MAEALNLPRQLPGYERVVLVVDFRDSDYHGHLKMLCDLLEDGLYHRVQASFAVTEPTHNEILAGLVLACTDKRVVLA